MMLPNDTKGLFGSSYAAFLTLADLELKRAERYRIFVTVLVLDLSFVRPLLGQQTPRVLREVLNDARKRVRCTDTIAPAGACRLVLLCPETPRENALTAAIRLIAMINGLLSERTGQTIEETIPVEMASYPDAAGAKTVATFLTELSQRAAS